MGIFKVFYMLIFILHSKMMFIDSRGVNKRLELMIYRLIIF